MSPVRNRRLVATLVSLAALLAVGAGTAAYISATARSSRVERAEELTGGNATKGLESLDRYGCGSCHNAEGLPRRADGIAPPLEGLSSRGYIAGVMENNPENLVRWIINPPAIDPQTAMPVVGVTEQDARDIAAYLYSLA